jgi:hypothetical protein
MFTSTADDTIDVFPSLHAALAESRLTNAAFAQDGLSLGLGFSFSKAAALGNDTVLVSLNHSHKEAREKESSSDATISI